MSIFALLLSMSLDVEVKRENLAVAAVELANQAQSDEAKNLTRIIDVFLMIFLNDSLFSGHQHNEDCGIHDIYSQCTL